MESSTAPATNELMPIQQQLDRILNRIDSFPLERFARMEGELQQLKQFVHDEAEMRRQLAEEDHKLALSFREVIDQQLDRAFAACRNDRDLRLAAIAGRVDQIEQREKQARDVSLRIRVALIGAFAALVVSLIGIAAKYLLPC